MSKCEHFKSQSYRTFACMMFQGHNGDGTTHKFKDTYISNTARTQWLMDKTQVQGHLHA